jgi:hypothetical protein
MKFELGCKVTEKRFGLGIDDLGFGISFGVWVPLRGLMIFDLGFRIMYYWGDFRGLGGFRSFRSFNLLNHLNSLNLLNFFDVITNHQRQGKCCFSGVERLGFGVID